jgi:hypothetical protein
MTSSGIRVYLISFRFLGKYVASFPVPDHCLYIPWLSHLHSRILSQRSHRLQTHCFGMYMCIYILYIMWLYIDTLFLMFYMHIYILLYIYTHTYMYTYIYIYIHTYIYIFIHIPYTPCWLDAGTALLHGCHGALPGNVPRDASQAHALHFGLRLTQPHFWMTCERETPARKHILGCPQSWGFNM